MTQGLTELELNILLAHRLDINDAKVSLIAYNKKPHFRSSRAF